MPRFCILCGQGQGSGLAVFSFPSRVDQRANWIEIIRRVKKNFVSNQIWHTRKLKNGICQKHFDPHDIRKGPKSRLCTGAIPSINIVSLTNKYDSVIKKCKTISDQNVDSKSLAISYDAEKGKLITGTNKIEYNIATVSEISNVFQKNCLICGKEGFLVDLLSVNSIDMLKTKKSMVQFLTSIIPESDSEAETDISKSHICKECEQNVRVVADMKYKLDERIRLLVASYDSTRHKIDLNESYKKSFKPSCNDKDKCESYIKVKKKGNFKNKDYSCLECSGVFSDLVNLLCHQCKGLANMKTNENSNLPKNRNLKSKGIKCSKCNKTLASQHTYLKHMDLHNVNFDCPVCGRFITTKQRLKFHMYKFHGVGQPKKFIYECKQCQKSFSSKPGLKYHEETFHKNGPKLICKLCDKIFYSSILYKSHKLYTHSKKSIICEKCGEMFFTVSKLNLHINAIHRQVKSWSCKICSDKFTTPGTYQQHNLLRHKNIGFSCSHCISHFRRKSLFVRHMWKHELYFCCFCGLKKDKKEFLAAHILEKHKRDFSNELDLDRKNNESFVDMPSDNITVSPEVIIDEEVTPVILKDILITDALESQNLHNTFSSNKNKQSYPDEKTIKLKSFEMLPPSQELSVVPFPFSNVGGLEVNQTIDDVSLLNVEMLDEIDITQAVPLKGLRLCEDEATSKIINSHMEVSAANSENIIRTSNDSPKKFTRSIVLREMSTITLSLDNQDSLRNSLVQAVNESFNSSHLESGLISAEFDSTQLYQIATTEKHNSKNDWLQRNLLLNGNEKSENNSNVLSINCGHKSLVPIIPDIMNPTVSIQDMSNSSSTDDVSQVTEEIGIHLGMNEESKLDVFDAAIDDVKLTHHEIPSLSLDMGNLKENTGYKYVMYINADLDKK